MPINDRLLGKYKTPGIFGVPECKMCGQYKLVGKDKNIYYVHNMNGIHTYNNEHYCEKHLLIVQRKEKLDNINEKRT